MTNMKRSRALKFTAVILAIIAALAAFYVTQGYRAAESAINISVLEAQDIQMSGEDVLFFGPEEASETAVVFYPGGKVQYEAYTPLCRELAARGINCALVKMPLNLAVFKPDAAEAVIDFMSEELGCSEFYMAGHSLGGVMAARYALQDRESNGTGLNESAETGRPLVKGLIFLASYPDKDLRGSGLRVLSIYGDRDGVLSMDKYEAALANMPEDFTELVIAGGNHSFFGDYGLQKGDGFPGITKEEQWAAAADAVAEWMQSE